MASNKGPTANIADPFLNKITVKARKQKRSQGSSHFRNKGQTELTPLPILKGRVLKFQYIRSLMNRDINQNSMGANVLKHAF